MIQQFLSNKWNLYGVYAMTYLMIGFLFEVTQMTFAQMFLAFVMMGIGNLVTYIYGIGRGMMLSAMSRPRFIQELDKLNELMKKENNTTSNKKCNKKKTKGDGCSSGGCNKC